MSYNFRFGHSLRAQPNQIVRRWTALMCALFVKPVAAQRMIREILLVTSRQTCVIPLLAPEVYCQDMKLLAYVIHFRLMPYCLQFDRLSMVSFDEVHSSLDGLTVLFNIGNMMVDAKT